MTALFVEEVLAVSKKMKHKYELKLVIISFSELLLSLVLPEWLRPLMFGLIQEMIDIKSRITAIDEKEKKKEAKDALKKGEEDDDDEDSEDEDS